MIYSSLRPLLFKLDPEIAHGLTLSLLPLLPSWLFTLPKPKPIKVLGINFNHPIGLAAGLDKDGRHIDGLAKLGFSFLELGTITPRPQSGNPKPRLFRLPKAQALINRMGFNNAGVDALLTHIQKAAYKGPLGINIGKNKDTPLDCASEDYIECLQKIYPYASYVTVNISSPNTPGLRQLQQGDYFRDLIAQLSEARLRLMDMHQRRVPILIKLSPDEPDESLKNMASCMVKQGIDGVIATNTTQDRSGVNNLPHAHEAGGLSGKPLKKRATSCIQLLKRETGNDLVIIGVGGIQSAADVQEKLAAGASLVQLYTGLIYQGPSIVKQLLR